MAEGLAIVFVYGTLKVGGHFAEQFDKFRLNSFDAMIYGTLFSVNDQFPAVILGGDNLVHGEVHSYRNGRSVLAAMDAIEGCMNPEEKHDPFNMFNRSTVIAMFEDDDAEVPATIYTWNLELDGLEIIEDGKWVL